MPMQGQSRLAPVVLLALLGCAELKDLGTLQQGLATEFAERNVTVNIMNHVQLTIVFVNSPLADQSKDDRAVTARRVGEYVRDHYPRFDSLTTISVGFSHNRSVGPVNVSDTDVPFTFTPAQLRQPVAETGRDSTAATGQPHN